jgi:hypothetical protein
MNHGINETNADVFVYTGEGGESPPQNILRVRVDPSVISIPDSAFYRRKQLTEVELCEGVVEIGVQSFGDCWHSITKINIPNSLRRIKYEAFSCSLQTPIRLHDGIESIGRIAFAHCIFTNFRVPPLLTVIPEYMLYNCNSVFSVELFELINEIGKYAFLYCYCLRNVAFPPDIVFGDDIFIEEEEEDDDDYQHTDLYQLFGSNARIIRELQHRFDGLPIHSLVYYQSYHQGVLQDLIAAINMRPGQHRTLRSKLDPTGSQQDCLGMTPLHILACSSVHNLEVYRLIVEKYPANLITEDRWGALPLLYAFWGAAPDEIIQFLLESYQSLYPGHVFNWTMMVKTIGRCDTPKENIENLLRVNLMHFPEQPIDWEYLLDEFASNSLVSINGAPLQERMRFLFTCGLSERMEALAFQVWRCQITNMISTAQWRNDNSAFLHQIQEKLTHFEDEFLRLKEATSILELKLWKVRMTMDTDIHQEIICSQQKKVRVDQSEFRRQCRVTCGASVVIGHVLPFLL